MKSKYSAMTSLLCTALCLFNAQRAYSTPALNYEVYLESWDPNYAATITGLPPGPSGGSSYTGVIVDVAFAELELTGSPFFNGLGFSPSSATSAGDLLTVNTTVSAAGGKVKISFGGQANNNFDKMYWFQATTGFPNNAVSLATGIATIFNTNYSALAGLDFDIEEQLTTASGLSHAEFADYLILFFQTLRSELTSLGLGNKIISITIPGQAWPASWKNPPATPAGYWELLCQNFFTIGSPDYGKLDYVNIMEYPLSILAGESYNFTQIVQDINYYWLPTTQTSPNGHPGWGIDPSKIQLGLCVASAAPGQTMLPSDMQKLAQAVNSPTVAYPNGFGAELYGVMIWDISLDAQPSRANPPVSPLPAPYAYSEAVRLGLTQTLPATSATEQSRRNQAPRTGVTPTSTRYGEPAYITPTSYPNPD